MNFSFPIIGQKAKTNSILSSPLRPHTVWRRMIAGFLLGVVIVVAWSFYLFWTSENSLVIDPFRSQVEDPNKKTNLERVEAYFDSRIDPLL